MTDPRSGGRWAVAAGVLITLSGLLHGTAGLVGEVRRPIAAGIIGPAAAGSMTVSWVFGSMAMEALGLVVLLAVPELRKGRRAAWRQCLVVGLGYVLFGLWAFWLEGGNPHFIGFIVIGALLVVPLGLGARAYSAD